MLETVAKRMGEMEITLTADSAAVEKLAEAGFDPVYGARPRRRAIQNQVEDLLAERMLAGEFKSGDKIELTVKDDKLDFVKK